MKNNHPPFAVKTIFCLFIFVVSIQFLWAQKTYNSVCSVYFATDKFDLNNQAIKQLDSFINQVNRSTDYLIDIEANTDADGSNGYNDLLSTNRAKAASDYLLKKGIVTNKIKSKAYGELKPLFTNETDNGKAGNRRVDLKTTLYRLENIEEVFKTVTDKSNQHFAIDTKKENKIKAANGTQITIPADAFMMEDGSSLPKGKVEFTVKEALNTADILFAGLTTVSDGKLLQTGGMVYIEATINGKKLKVAKNKNIDVALPTQKQVDGMQLFVGEKNKDGSVNWKPTGQKPKEAELNIDKSALKKIKLDEKKNVKPQLDSKGIPAAPAKPKEPKKPAVPKEPGVAEFKPGFFERFFYSKEKIKSIENNMNEKLQAEYDRRQNLYEKNLKKYEEYTIQYNEELLPKYQENMKKYNSELKQRAEEINTELREYAKRVAAKMVNLNVKIFLKQPFTSKAKLYYYFQIPKTDTLNGFRFTYKNVGAQNIQWDNRRQRKSRCCDFTAYIPFIPTIVLKDGSTIYPDITSLVNQEFARLADSTGLNKLVYEYNQQIIEAGAKAGIKSGNIFSPELSNYIYSVNQLNYINCDRFVQNDNPVMVRIDEQDAARIFVLCNDVNGYLEANKYAKYYRVSSVPKNSNITIISIKMKDGKLLMASQKTKADSKTPYQLDYKVCTLTEIKEQLKRIESKT